jgi:hypothetical protein
VSPPSPVRACVRARMRAFVRVCVRVRVCEIGAHVMVTCHPRWSIHTLTHMPTHSLTGVALAAQLEGDQFRLASDSGGEELFSTQMSKILLAKNVDTNVYVMVRRSKQEGKYACHCLTSKTKDQVC